MTRVRPRETALPPKSGKLTPAQEREIAEWRAAFVARIGSCEVCRQCPLDTLCGHEIVRAGLRKYVKQNPALILVVGFKCHKRIHDEAWSVPRQLAYVMVRRPLDFRLSEVNRWSIKRITRADVMAFAREIEDPKEPWMDR